MNSVKQTLGFFSMTVAWALMNLLHSIYLGWTEGKADDSGVVIFWSGLFIAFAWVLFIVYPLKKLDHSKSIFKPTKFPFVTAVYGVATYAIIVGVLFHSFKLILMFLPLALLTGFLFGACYSLLVGSKTVVVFVQNQLFARLLLILSPVWILIIFLWLLPAIAPSLVFRYMPDEIRNKIVGKTIPKFKVGEDIEPLKRSLPGYLDHIENGSGNMAATMEDFAFVIQVHCNKIIRLEYGNNLWQFDNTIYGKLQEKPCP